MAVALSCVNELSSNKRRLSRNGRRGFAEVLGVGLGLGLTVESVGVYSLNSIVCSSKSNGNERLAEGSAI